MKTHLACFSLALLLVAFIPCLHLIAEDPPPPSNSSWEKAAPPPVAGPSKDQVIAEGELATGESVKITQLKRTSGDTITLKFVVRNVVSGDTPVEVFGGDWYSWDLRNVFLLDVPNKKKYFILKDSAGQALSSRGNSRIKPGEQRTLWAKFPAPPATVSSITVEIPTAAPFDDLPITPQG